MAKKAPKFYVVWQGNTPGIYTTWSECEKQVKGVQGAKFKSFESRSLAEQAFRLGPTSVEPGSGSKPTAAKKSFIVGIDAAGMTTILPHLPEQHVPELNSLAVDAACSGNPGVMEYQGVHVASRQQLFKFKAPIGTNNIGEFLAIVHGLAYLKKNNLPMPLYSDSKIAMGWIAKKECKSKLPLTPETQELYEIIRRAETWLCNNTYSTQICKWDTELWGEIPADFGRKG